MRSLWLFFEVPYDHYPEGGGQGADRLLYRTYSGAKHRATPLGWAAHPING
jgi:hypothetical protein